MSEFWVWDLGFGVLVFGIRVSDFGLRVSGVDDLERVPVLLVLQAGAVEVGGNHLLHGS